MRARSTSLLFPLALSFAAAACESPATEEVTVALQGDNSGTRLVLGSSASDSCSQTLLTGWLETTASASWSTATISIDGGAPVEVGQIATTDWVHDGRTKAFYFDYPRSQVRLAKEGDYWKIDIPVTPEMRNRVDRLVRNHRDYVNALKKMSEEVRTERTTKVDVTNRLEELLSEAVTAAK